MKRRDLLKAGSGALALSSLMVAPVQVQAADSPAFAWNRAAAEGLVGQTFWLSHPDRRAVALVLRMVRAMPQQPHVEQFSLYFDSTEAGIAAGTYDIENSAVGQFALHVAPVTAAPRNKRYRADFSLLA